MATARNTITGESFTTTAAKAQGPFKLEVEFRGQPFTSTLSYAELRTWGAWARNDSRYQNVAVLSRTGRDVTFCADILPLLDRDVISD